jgi:hypothetical protein
MLLPCFGHAEIPSKVSDLPTSLTSDANLSLRRYLGPWKVLREPDSTRRYCGTAISFVSFCLKASSLPSDKIPTRFTDSQQAALNDYKEYLMASLVPSANDITRFQSALFSVLFREEGFEIDTAGRMACPVQSYMALLSLRGLGQFVNAGLVTQPVSRLLYLSRSAVLQVALHDCNEAEGFMKLATTRHYPSPH